MRIAVTGASGFVGGALLPALAQRGCETVIVRRDAPADLAGCTALIHLAGLAHRRAGLDAMRAANRDHALAAAEAARAAGVGRFVFISTINVVAGHRNTVLSPALPPLPLSDYGRAKAEAEAVLLAMEGIEMVVLRPPLVFGPGAPGNLRALMRLCASGLPLPFGCVRNRRSMIGVTNLCDALFFLASADRRQVAGGIFHIAEDEPFSLSGIVAECRAAMGRPARLVCLPPRLLAGTLGMLGLGGMAEQMFGDLLVDDRSLRAAGWRPGATAARDLSAMARSWC